MLCGLILVSLIISSHSKGQLRSWLYNCLYPTTFLASEEGIKVATLTEFDVLTIVW